MALRNQAGRAAIFVPVTLVNPFGEVPWMEDESFVCGASWVLVLAVLLTSPLTNNPTSVDLPWGVGQFSSLWPFGNVQRLIWLLQLGWCYWSLWVEASEAVKPPMMHRTGPSEESSDPECQW